MAEAEILLELEKGNAKPHGALGGKLWPSLGCAIIIVAYFLFLLADSSSPEFWPVNFYFTALVTGVSLIVIVPAYAIYLVIVAVAFRKLQASATTKRSWVLGLPLLLLVLVILYAVNQIRPTVAIRWLTADKRFDSIRSVHSAHISTMMADRSVAWFKINSNDLHNLINQHQMEPTNGVNISALISADRVLSESSIAGRIPVFLEPVCYARAGSDEAQHPFRIYAVTNPKHDEVLWFAIYDR